ncbi:twin-arginine translocation signal domain-containing protein [Streptomyces sp. NPDC059828]|uniref:twin-arginine translocation signal domain-containing protein n=1 Tax=Streptomyces sp. NPDC059828 TaxID=3346965 RepID=UPI0036521615
MNRRNFLTRITTAAGAAAVGSVAAGAVSPPAAEALVTDPRTPRNPRISEWQHAKSTSLPDPGRLTDQFQGMCTDGSYWYVVVNDGDFRGIYRMTMGFVYTGLRLAVPSGCPHIGAPTFDPDRRQIYVPVEGTEPPKIWKVSTDLRSLGMVPMWGRATGTLPPQSSKNPYLAFNPYDRLVYSSVSGFKESSLPRVDAIHGYDRDSGLLRKTIPLPSGLHRVQGATFGPDGMNFYVASDYEEASNGCKHIYAYDFSHARDGVTAPTWGKVAVPHADNEVECVVLASYAWRDARATSVIVGILDDAEYDFTDDVYLRHFWVPDPARL